MRTTTHPPRRARTRVSAGRRIGLAAVCAALLVTAACSSSDGGSSSSTTAAGSTGSTPSGSAPGGAAPSGTTPGTAVDRPDGPAADVSEELTAGTGVFMGEAETPDFAAVGYEQHEYVAEGTATSYQPESGELPADGRYDLVEDQTADYRTRIVVRRPANPEDSNGTVVVEWLNVSGGVDAGPDFSTMTEELFRGGYTWVGVSAQKIGVEGGTVAVQVSGPGADVAGKGLKAIDPARYGSLSHPGDAFSYDIYTQVARALRSPEGDEVLGGATPDRVIAVGESQSAFTMTTYIDGVQPLTKAFDGFVVHSRGGAAAPLGGPPAADGSAGNVDIASALTGKPTIIRTDMPWPVLVVETENDLTSVIGYYPARQPDSDTFRRWEMAGTAHADARLVGANAESMDCGTEINTGPQHFIIKAALRAMDTWVRTGEAPPEAEELQVDASGEKPAIVRDADGIAMGGIRTPLVDVPVDVLSGNPGPNPSVICLLLGSTVPLPAERIAALYDDQADYLARYEQATDAAIEAGFVLEEDRQAMLDEAQPDRVTG